MSAEEGGKVSLSAPSNGLSAEEELRQLRDKTNAWKQSVAIQLSEAAKKNKQLRDELKDAEGNHEQDMLALRVQLDKEFRERTNMKDEEINDMQRQMTQLREEKRRMAEEHKKNLEETVIRIRENSRMEHASKAKTDAEQHEAELRKLRDVIEQKEQAIVQAEHEAAVMRTRLDRLGEQYRELSGLMTHDARQLDKQEAEAEDAAKGGASSQHLVKLSEAAHKQQLEIARSELRGLEERFAVRLRETQRTHEVERQRWVEDMYQREEQLLTLQTLLRQAQHEAETANQRIAAAGVEKERSEQCLAQKVAALSKELATRMEQSQLLNVEVGRLQREVSSQEALIHGLEEEARIREEAFTSLTLSEDNRNLVQGLQKALQESREEAELWRCRYEEALQDATGATTVVPFGEGKNDTTKLVSSELTQREEALAKEEVRLELKARLLKSTEARLEELKRSLASQASVILQQHDSDDDGRRRDMERSEKQRRGGAFLASPQRYMQMIREQQGDSILSFPRRLLSYLLFMRLRTAITLFLLLFCFLVVFITM
ncbi:hypothetical protein TraAM80_01436 [Trypanosoma rangeli]|uniref:Uncharacterized protein n=1 Tax=Trypanosoma rangeli TaxID=5698 RepID=A0A3R7KMY4_TRYRA|nr:uncharacterized protein TraAM80_01436 [Trypanosoma rangeli]RNF10620.1 hypothetical protein TraAM80_01436 [Trypanosoma rangeli]|eukprot:RNF10620.1 hypothetical protein TraAM80_01436 [Trypanosoma rangeli]